MVALSDNRLAESYTPQRACRVDGHVHLHLDFDFALTLDNALHNMALSPESESSIGFLLLTEMAGINRFNTFPDSAGAWSVAPCVEAMSRCARHEGGCRIFVIAGRQIITSEGLEVLAHGIDDIIPDGLPLDGVMAVAEDHKAIAVLPWAVGKWTGKRGRIIQSLVASPPASDRFFIADSGVRLRGTPRPRLLATAEQNGWCVLAGSDPLPLPNQVSAVGRFGFVAEFPLDPDRPFKSLEAWLRACRRSPESYGALQGLSGFLRHQVAMQIRKRLR